VKDKQAVQLPTKYVERLLFMVFVWKFVGKKMGLSLVNSALRSAMLGAWLDPVEVSELAFVSSSEGIRHHHPSDLANTQLLPFCALSSLDYTCTRRIRGQCAGRRTAMTNLRIVTLKRFETGRQQIQTLASCV
jgi:hypothetical protein